jgi:hypothetical protein
MAAATCGCGASCTQEAQKGGLLLKGSMCLCALSLVGSVDHETCSQKECHVTDPSAWDALGSGAPVCWCIVIVGSVDH